MPDPPSLQPTWPAEFGLKGRRKPKAPELQTKYLRSVSPDMLTNCSPTFSQARRLCSPKKTQLCLAASWLKIALIHGHSQLKGKQDGGRRRSFPASPATLSHAFYLKRTLYAGSALLLPGGGWASPITPRRRIGRRITL